MLAKAKVPEVRQKPIGARWSVPLVGQHLVLEALCNPDRPSVFLFGEPGAGMDSAADVGSRLTYLDHQILDALANGLLTKEIAVRIQRSRATVELRVRILRAIFGARSRAHLVAITMQTREAPRPPPIAALLTEELDAGSLGRLAQLDINGR